MKYFSIIIVLFFFFILPGSIFTQHNTHPEPLGLIYELDKHHSLMDFTTRHFGFGRVRGTFNDYRASMYMEGEKLESISVQAVIDISSLDTQNPGRDDHLKKVFFDVEQYPHIIFKSDKVMEDMGQYQLYGKLTIKDVTREVILPLSVFVMNETDQWENQRVVLESELTIDRNDYDVIYDNEFWDGIVDNVIKIDISFAAYHYNARNNIFPWRKNSIGTFIKDGIEKEGLDSTIQKVKDLKSQGTEEYQFGISHFNRAGLALAQAGNIDAGIEILELAITIHQEEAQATEIADLYASIAQLQLSDNNLYEGQEILQKALEIDPLNPSAAVLHRKLNLE